MMADVLLQIREVNGVAGAKLRDDGQGVIVQCRADANRHEIREICDKANLALTIESVDVGLTPEEEEIADLPKMIRFTTICLVTTVAGWILNEVGGVPSWIVWGVFVVAYIFGGYFTSLKALNMIRNRQFGIDMLMILAALGAAAVGEPREGALLMFLFSLSGTLETYAMGRTHASIRSLIAMTPREAEVVDTRGVRIISVEALEVGDVVLVRPGAQIPADGVIIRGESTINEASITGESVPVDKKVDAKVFAGTINGQGALEIEVRADASQSTLARIVSVVREAREQKAQSQDFTDRIVGVYYAYLVVVVTIIAFIIGVAWIGEPWAAAFYRAMTLMVVMSPCALVISIPAALLSALARSARDGVLFKGGRYLEAAATVKVVALDKTGTVTTGQPQVVAVIPVGGPGRISEQMPCIDVQEVLQSEGIPLNVDQIRLLVAAAAVESPSEHPLAKAVVQGALKRGLIIPTVTEFKAIVAAGASGVVCNQRLRVGKPTLFANVTPDVMIEIEALQRQGNTVIAIGSDIEIWGLIAIADTVRPETRQALRALQNDGVKLALLTGDNQHVAYALAKDLGIDDVRADLLPQDKVSAIKDLQRLYGSVAMIGDGVNDAPALATADLGVAMGKGGTDVAHESADVVLMRDDLSKLAGALRLAKRARRVVWQNLVFAMSVIIMLVIFTIRGDVELTLGVIGHEGSTLLVVANGLRLLWPSKA
ncbi:MAG: heavy metal translocating P-type ATPase [Chloroflexota bacterium]|jgi:Cd2+/Zn2+-exporting ATPase